MWKNKDERGENAEKNKVILEVNWKDDDDDEDEWNLILLTKFLNTKCNT